MTVVPSRVTLARAKTTVFQFIHFVLHARAFGACVRVQFFAWRGSHQPTDEGLSPKRLVQKNKLDTFESIFAYQYVVS